MLTIGIDPGLSGAVAALDLPNQRFTAIDIPTFEIDGKRSVNHRALLDWLENHDHADYAVLERVSAMPGQGVASMFNFGAAYGACQTALAALKRVPWQLVTPGTWKKALAVPSDKDGARQRATQLLPWASAAWGRKKDHNVAEAALLALYATKIAGAKT